MSSRYRLTLPGHPVTAWQPRAYEGQGAPGAHRGSTTCDYPDCDREKFRTVRATLVDPTAHRLSRYAMCSGHNKQWTRLGEFRPLRAFSKTS